jgi:hypothetical protein
MLETKHDNSGTTFASSSIKLSRVAKSISILNLRLMDITKFDASLNNQWPLYWFAIQAYSRGPQKSTVI